MNVASLENVGNGARGLSEWRSREEAVAAVLVTAAVVVNTLVL